eukprot:8318854-Pyramimonas_sp.AAC.1
MGIGLKPRASRRGGRSPHQGTSPPKAPGRVPATPRPSQLLKGLSLHVEVGFEDPRDVGIEARRLHTAEAVPQGRGQRGRRLVGLQA